MDSLRRAEILIYLLLIAPRSGLLEGQEGPLREWTSRVLAALAPDWTEEDRGDIEDQFASFVPRLRRTLGMVSDGSSALHFQIDQQFLIRAEFDEDLNAERERLLWGLRRVNELLEIPNSSQVAVVPNKELAPRAEGTMRRPAAFAMDVSTFLTEPGLDALDNETFARLLARDTGA